MSDQGTALISFLVDAGCDKGVIDHCLTVHHVAVSLANRIISAGTLVDSDLIAAGAILHDIGRSKTHGMDHADAGASICRSLRFDERICLIVEHHIGAGITAEERVQFGLSAEDRIPKTLEEKIVAHADNIVKGSRVMSESEFLTSISRLPEPVRSRLIILSDEMKHLAGISSWFV